MKTAIPAPLLAHYASGATTLAHALRITRTDGAVFAFNSSGIDVTISGVTYGGTHGLEISSLASAVGMVVDNLELTTQDDGTLFTSIVMFPLPSAW